MPKYAAFVLTALALATACQRHSAETPTPTPAEDPDWIRLEIPGEREAPAVAGSLDGTLLVTTYTHAYVTADQGRTWQQTKNFFGSVEGLVTRHDTVVALRSVVGDLYDKSAVHAELFTTDYGRTWQDITSITDPRGTLARLRQSVGRVQAINGPAYRVKFNYTPFAPGSSSYYSEPSDLVKIEGGSQTTLRAPAKLVFRNLQLDARNRLYVTAASCAHRTALTDCPDCQPGNGQQSPAVVFISRKPLP